MKNLRFCAGCGTQLFIRHKIKFCSNKCQCALKYRTSVDSWKKGKLSGGIGITARNLASWLRRYLIKKYDNKCCKCGWAKTNPVTGKIPLVVNHINGDSTNSKESNLELICPCCDSLTPTYMGLNKGKGREARRRKRQASR